MKVIVKILAAVLALSLIFMGGNLIFPPLIDAYQREQAVQTTAKEFLSQYGTAAQPVETTPSTPNVPETTTAEGDTPEQTEPATEAQEVPYQQLLDEMKAVNHQIYVEEQVMLQDSTSYEVSVLDLTKYGITNGVVGVISIPKINIEMPLYLGATWDHMANGFAQLSQTSMPIGGENTNCVIAGHRGWSGMKYLRDVEELALGDSVYLHNLWETLEYRVVDLQIVLPHDRESIVIQEGRDLITLLTCHPYGSGGKYRYLVICERYIPNKGEESEPVTQIDDQTFQNVFDDIFNDFTEKANNVTPQGITTYDGSEFVSSRREILMLDMLPMLCVLVVLLVLLLWMLCNLIRNLRRSVRKRRAKKLAGQETEDTDES